MYNTLHIHVYKESIHQYIPGEMCEPWGVAVTPDDHIVLADNRNNRLQVFTLDGDFVRFVRFKSPGGNSCQLFYFSLRCTFAHLSYVRFTYLRYLFLSGVDFDIAYSVRYSGPALLLLTPTFPRTIEGDFQY